VAQLAMWEVSSPSQTGETHFTLATLKDKNRASLKTFSPTKDRTRMLVQLATEVLACTAITTSQGQVTQPLDRSNVSNGMDREPSKPQCSSSNRTTTLPSQGLSQGKQTLTSRLKYTGTSKSEIIFKWRSKRT